MLKISIPSSAKTPSCAWSAESIQAYCACVCFKKVQKEKAIPKTKFLFFLIFFGDLISSGDFLNFFTSVWFYPIQQKGEFFFSFFSLSLFNSSSVPTVVEHPLLTLNHFSLSLFIHCSLHRSPSYIGNRVFYS